MNLVTTITPLRISFVGGGTDFPDFFKQNEGSVLSTTINKYIYVTVKRHNVLFDENYRLNYSKTEKVKKVKDIENDIIRECLKLVKVEPPILISTGSDLPAESGLGSSSSFAVGLLNALHNFKGEQVSPAQLAEEACTVEVEMIKKPMGYQDQYAAAFGGINMIFFNKNGRTSIDPISLKEKGVNYLLENSLLVWTGIQRESKKILEEQQSKMNQIEGQLLQIKSICESFYQTLLKKNKPDLKLVGEFLSNSWEIKRNLTDSISNSKIDHLYRKLINNGALGGKLLGAGGGGFLFMIAEKKFHNKILSLFPSKINVPIKYEPRGSRIITAL